MDSPPLMDTESEKVLSGDDIARCKLGCIPISLKSLVDQAKFVVQNPEPEIFGPLLVPKLPSDAWENWCKDGVVCFAMESSEMLKVYFADPRDLSVYHVIDFDYLEFERMPFSDMGGCILSGSKIYMIGGCTKFGRDLTDVLVCDVATPPQLRDGGGYEWKWENGPSLNGYKDKTLVFSVAGNIYVLSLGDGERSKPFEVLKSGSGRWEVLSPPPFLSLEGYGGLDLKGSFVIDDKKIVIHLLAVFWSLFIVYDPVNNEWAVKKASLQNPFLQVRGEICYSLDVRDKGFLLSAGGNYPVVDFGSNPNPLQAFFSLDPPNIKLLDSLLDIGPYPYPTQWHLFQLRGRKFCLLALYDNYKSKCYVRLGTFDLVEHSSDARVGTSDSSDSSDGSDSKRLKLACWEVTNLKIRSIDLLEGSLSPYLFCTKTGAFSLC